MDIKVVVKTLEYITNRVCEKVKSAKSRINFIWDHSLNTRQNHQNRSTIGENSNRQKKYTDDLKTF